MKNLFYIVTALLFSFSTQGQTAPAGENTFGCIINGQVFYPRGGTGTIWTPAAKAVKFRGDPSGNRNFNEIEVFNYKDGKPASEMIIHLQGLYPTGIGEYIWKPSNFQSSIDGLMQNYVYARIYHEASGTWKYYGSYENSGKVTITKYDNIVSGNFSGKLRLYNGTDEIDIKSGRFDINSSTLSSALFP